MVRNSALLGLQNCGTEQRRTEKGDALPLPRKGEASASRETQPAVDREETPKGTHEGANGKADTGEFFWRQRITLWQTELEGCESANRRKELKERIFRAEQHLFARERHA
jgi:hypothetical protein